MAEPARPDSSGTAASGPDELSESHLWRRWVEHRDEAARTLLVTRYLPFARMHAAMVYKGRFHDEIEFAEYQQLASVGLLEAVDGFRLDAGVQFRTYAAYRVKGAILSGLEKISEKHQQIALRKRLQRDRLEAVPHDAASPPASLSQADLLKYLAEVGVGLALGILLEGSGMVAAGDGPQAESLAQSPDVLYFRKSEIRQLKEWLGGWVDRLPEQERRVIHCHYQQEVPFDDIARMMDVSRSRVSQIHRKALARLRECLADRMPTDLSW